jgi:hypothetical protein
VVSTTEEERDVMIPECGGEGQADGAVPKRFVVEEERSTNVEAHAEEGTRWRHTGRKHWRSGHRQVCGGEIIGLGFMGSGTLKKKNISDGRY